MNVPDSVKKGCKEPKSRKELDAFGNKREACGDETKKLKGKAFQDIIIEVLRSHSCRNLSFNLLLSVSHCKNLTSEMAFVIFTFFFFNIHVLHGECTAEGTSFFLQNSISRVLHFLV